MQILEKGAMGGSKGYFCAIYDEKEGLKINVEEIQLQQPWWIKSKSVQKQRKAFFVNLRRLNLSFPKNLNLLYYIVCISTIIFP